MQILSIVVSINHIFCKFQNAVIVIAVVNIPINTF